MSSLAEQLRRLAPADRGHLTRTVPSFLFTPKIAAEYDVDAIFSIGQAGFEALTQLDARFKAFDYLFAEEAKGYDRIMKVT